MALLLPKRLPSTSTDGERKVARLLSSKLDDNIIVYYEPKVGKFNPDFVLIGENLGMLVLEIKDYLMSNLNHANTLEWVFTDGSKSKSPYKQARQYSLHVYNVLSKDTKLNPNGQGLSFNYGYGVVFTNITRFEFISAGLDDVYEMHRTIFKDDLENLKVDELFDVLYSLHNFRNKLHIDDELRDRIRFLLFPEVRVGVNENVYDSGKLSKFRSLHTMDLYQETFARDIGSGHRLLRGVAGSGKTLILVARAKILFNNDSKSKILICCYNVTLREYIKGLLGEEYKKIEVKTFHEFIASTYRLYDIDNLAMLEDMIASSIQYRKMYDTILVDEAQDMDPSWIKFLHDSLKSETKDLLICMDNAQSIFKSNVTSESGLDFRGRSNVLNLNYRNPKIIIDFAWKYYNHYVDSSKNPDIINPSSIIGRRGDLSIKRFTSFHVELDYLCEVLTTIPKDQTICIIYRVNRLKIPYVDMLMERLNLLNIEFDWVTEHRDSKANYKHRNGVVKLLTVESSKGLTFDNVFLMAFTSVHTESFKDIERLTMLSYIAITRSTSKLLITFHEENVISEGLEINGTNLNSF